MSVPVAAINTALLDHAQTLGKFASVGLSEPKNAPPSNVALVYWFAGYRPVPNVSGLDITGVRVEFQGRLYLNMLQEPQDAIDGQLMIAADALIGAYVADFDLDKYDPTLAGVIHSIDVFGAYGPQLEAKAGYLSQDSKMFRAIEITLPIICNDIWPQGNG